MLKLYPTFLSPIHKRIEETLSLVPLDIEHDSFLLSSSFFLKACFDPCVENSFNLSILVYVANITSHKFVILIDLQVVNFLGQFCNKRYICVIIDIFWKRYSKEGRRTSPLAPFRSKNYIELLRFEGFVSNLSSPNRFIHRKLVKSCYLLLFLALLWLLISKF